MNNREIAEWRRQLKAAMKAHRKVCRLIAHMQAAAGRKK